MTNYSDIEIHTAKNLLGKGFKWIARSIYGAIIAYKIKPGQEKYVSGSVICSDYIPIFESIKRGDDPVSLESIVHPQILDDAERKYLSAFIKPFRDRMLTIAKIHENTGEYFIELRLCTNGREQTIDFPYFYGGMYEGMEDNIGYTLKALGL